MVSPRIPLKKLRTGLRQKIGGIFAFGPENKLSSATNGESPGVSFGSDAGLGDSFGHAARMTGVVIMVSNSIGVKRPSAA